MDVENSIFGCKRIYNIILFYLDYQFEWIYSIGTNEGYFVTDHGPQEQFAAGQYQTWTKR